MAGASTYSQDIVHHLRSVPGKADLKQVVLAVLCRAKDLLQEPAHNSRIVANGLRFLAMENSLPLGSIYNDIWWFDDALDLSESQIMPDTQDEIVAKMIEALATRIAELRDEQTDEREPE